MYLMVIGFIIIKVIGIMYRDRFLVLLKNKLEHPGNKVYCNQEECTLEVLV